MKRITLITAIALALTLAGCATAPKQTTPPQANPAELVAKAEKAVKRGQLDNALSHYLQALEQKPGDPAILMEIGEIQTQLGHTEYALKAFTDVLEKQPDNVEALTSLGLHKLNMGENEQALIYLNKAADLDQLRLLTQTSLVVVGETAPLQPLDENSPLRCYNALGILKDLSGDYADAREYYRLVLNRAPSAANVLTNLGYSYYLDGNLRQAEIHLRQAVQKQPDFKRAWNNLGLVYARMKHYKRALVALKQVMPEADALNDLGYFAMLEGRYGDAQELFWKAIDASPIYFAKAQDNLEKLRELQGKATAGANHYRPVNLLLEAEYKAKISAEPISSSANN
ncbi:tetratricopeptide repeat protein [Ferrimonas futtsuensis]|uniref:tetratricopeptide repeat protein n=1 Tax=Ferrimonas futtsuensis TaxID=364764 RepID=UPI00042129AB|nr:tetratricopeptide repeat protein [Ferrimonas futtsuensis]